MTSADTILAVVSIVFLLGIIASKASVRLGVPALLLFLLIGMLAGSEGIGGIAFDDPGLAQAMGVIALVFILYSGGLDTNWQRIRPVLWRGVTLSTAAVLMSALLVGWFATVVLKFNLLEGVLLGAIVSSTDAAAVFSVLRSKSVSLRGRLKDVLELESGSNDPMAVYLTMASISLLTGKATSILDLVPMFVLQMGLGAAAGYAAGRGMVMVVNRVKLEYEGLYPVLTIAMVLLTYSATALVGGNGFLAVYVAGVVMGQRRFIHRKSLRVFHDGLAWLMQISMFFVLGLLVFPSRLVPVAGEGLLIALFLMLAARPLSVVGVLLLDRRMRMRHKLFISWVGLRGAVPIILATFPLLAGIGKADLIFDLVFFIVLTSVLVQGTTITPVARWLGLQVPFQPRREYPLEYFPTGSEEEREMKEVEVQSGSLAAGKSIMELKFPSGALVVLLNRNGDFIVPGGSTKLEEGDTILVLGHRAALEEVRSKLSGPRENGGGE